MLIYREFFCCCFYLDLSKTRNFIVAIMKSNVIHNGTAVLWKESRQNPLSKIKLKLTSSNVKLKLWAKFFSHICIMELKPVILSSYKTGSWESYILIRSKILDLTSAIYIFVELRPKSQWKPVLHCHSEGSGKNLSFYILKKW